LVVIFWVGWNSYLSKKYGSQNANQTTEAEVSTKPTDNPQAEDSNSKSLDNQTTGEIKTANTLDVNVEKPEETVDFDFPNWKVSVSSKGMGLKEVVIKSYTGRDGNPVVIGKTQSEYLYSTKLNGFSGVPHFELTKTSDTELRGRFEKDGLIVEKFFILNPTNYSIRSKILVSNLNSQFVGLSNHLVELKQEASSSSIFQPSMEHQEFYVIHEGKKENLSLSQAKEPLDKEFKNVSVASIGSQYFAGAILDKSKIMPAIHITLDPSKDKYVSAEMNYTPAGSTQNNFEVETVGYFGPKVMSLLESVDSDMSGLVNFGFFSVIAKPLLVLMKLFYGFIGNWGIAIILLTLLVRMLVLPINISSFKSMKAMQKVNPMIQALKEKYKDDPAALNRETMALFKEHKVNPLGGCLPMLLQIPIFFALYQVLGQSIELYQSPFFGWIHDLSLKDPFYVLPLLMGISMFVQQKITPSAADPVQAKMMLFMPVIFSLMMFGLPSGLTLYIFVSTLFGIFQQLAFMRDKSKPLFANK
jgi:YidC/Oxa1 family membrane protein insertase